MPEPTTPEEWLPVLAQRLDERRAGLARLRRYAHGHADLPEMGPNLKASWKAFQRKARTDYGGIAVRSLRNRIRPNGIRIGTTDDHPALVTARSIERDNRLSTQITDAVRDYLETGIGYIAVRIGSDGGVLVRREKPEQLIAVPDPEKSWKARVTLKVWRDEAAKTDFARITMPGMAQLFTRPSVTASGSVVGSAAGEGWSPASDPTMFDGDASTVILDREDDGAFLGPHLDVIDRINLGKLQRLVTTAMQAFRQRAMKAEKNSGGLPAEDENGSSIDWARAFEPAPGALWELPEGIDIWESQQTDITPMLAGEKQDARDFAAATGTPISVLIPDGANQSAEGAANAKEQQIDQARDDIARIRPAIELALVYALRAAGVDLGDATVEMLFAPPEHVSLSERYAAAVQAKGAGLAARTIKRDILGMTPDQIAQDEADAGSDMLAMAMMGASDQKAQFDALGVAISPRPA